MVLAYWTAMTVPCSWPKLTSSLNVWEQRRMDHLCSFAFHFLCDSLWIKKPSSLFLERPVSTMLSTQFFFTVEIGNRPKKVSLMCFELLSGALRDVSGSWAFTCMYAVSTALDLMGAKLHAGAALAVGDSWQGGFIRGWDGIVSGLHHEEALWTLYNEDLNLYNFHSTSFHSEGIPPTVPCGLTAGLLAACFFFCTGHVRKRLFGMDGHFVTVPCETISEKSLL